MNWEKVPSLVKAELLKAEYTVEEVLHWTPQEVWEKWCTWHGLINWAPVLRDTCCEIFGGNPNA